MKRIAGLILILSMFWLINSGYFKPLLLGFGTLSVIGVVWISRRMDKVDGAQVPTIMLTVRLPAYLLWLLWEIIKSNIDVVRYIWQRRPDISPVIFRVKAGQKSDIGKVMYANSITLTPGTVTLDIQDDMFEVHALTRAGAAGVETGDMDRRVCWLEGQT